MSLLVSIIGSIFGCLPFFVFAVLEMEPRERLI